MNWKSIFTIFSFFICYTCGAQPRPRFTHADTLRGSITTGRIGWDVLHYDLSVSVDINDKSLAGCNEITYYESLPVRKMQIDLQAPMIIDSIINEAGFPVSFTNEGNVWWARFLPDDAMIKFLPGVRKIKIYYHGMPRIAFTPPWDGGFVWKKDMLGNPWVATAVQGLGASAWWPCKDHQSDEPDSGMVISITAPDTLVAISNGRLIETSATAQGYKKWQWKVVNPINTYDVTVNIGKYVSWNDTLHGEAGVLDLQFWVLNYNLQLAKEQFKQVKPTLRCLEHWFSKYPFYQDGYKLVETPFLGMEHQSAIAYGNDFQNGYLGTDRSATGWGKKWDFVIVHESGHEWFGNSITSADIADMWIHEAFTTYGETLYTEWLFGKEAGDEYTAGTRSKIKNDIPIIGKYGVNKEGSTDMYNKGANMIHVIRNTIHDDEKFRNILRGLNEHFYHSIVTSKQVEEFISKESGIDFSTVFRQYLQTTQVPALEYYFFKEKLFYRWTNSVNGLALPVYIIINGKEIILPAKNGWNSIANRRPKLDASDIQSVEKKYYITTVEVKRPKNKSRKD